MSNEWRVLKQVKGYKSLVWVEGKLLLCKGKSLYFYEPQSDIIYKFLDLIDDKYSNFLSSIGIINRLLRIHISYAFYSVYFKKLFVVINGSILTVDVERSEIQNSFKLPRGNKVLNMAEVVGVNGFADCICFGEYFNNIDFDCVNIYKWTPYQNWSVVYTFDKNCMYHIHNLIVDVNRNVIYCFTGDLDKHSAIWEFKYDFKVSKILFSGNQLYRACTGFVDKSGLLYATDSQFCNNYLCRVTFNGADFKHEILNEIEGSVIYASRTNDEYVFSTTVEPNTFKTKLNIFDLLVCKRGNGIKSKDIYLLSYNSLDNSLKILLKNEKDWLPFILFQFGTMAPCICSLSNNYLAVFCNATVKYDNTTTIFSKIH